MYLYFSEYEHGPLEQQSGHTALARFYGKITVPILDGESEHVVHVCNEISRF